MVSPKNWLKRLRNRTPKYQLCDDTGGFLAPILITSGKFKGVKFIIGNVCIKDNTLKFKTEVFENRVKTEQDPDLFTKVTGDILMELIKNSKKQNMPVLINKRGE